jgi:hypothetical protein
MTALMEHFITLFDSWFLPQGLALHSSLQEHAGPYTLWILCMDHDAELMLKRLNLPNVHLLSLSEVETPDLLRVKAGRTPVEYCWTLTPVAPRLVFEADPGVRRVTYVDADVWFRRNPAPLLRELEASGKQVLITDHAYAPEHDKSATSGQYCVQFVTFTHAGEVVRKWWEDRCIEWCFARCENGKFGDQKYLDDWPERFADHVHVLQHPEWTQAPWNATRFPYSSAVMYHFQSLRFIGGRTVSLGEYPLPPALMLNVYEPYLNCLRTALATLAQVGFVPRLPRQRPSMLWRLKRTLYGLYVHLWRVRYQHYRAL